MSDELVEEVSSLIPLGRVGEPADIADAIVNSAADVAAARELGMTALLFRDVRGFRDVVSRRRLARRAGCPPGREGTPPPGPPS